MDLTPACVFVFPENCAYGYVNGKAKTTNMLIRNALDWNKVVEARTPIPIQQGGGVHVCKIIPLSPIRMKKLHATHFAQLSDRG